MALHQQSSDASPIELNPLYVDVAIQRWQEFTGEAATLEGLVDTADIIQGSSIVVSPGQTAISGGAESVSVSNSGEVVGNVDLGGGDNVLTNAAGGSITGNIITGDGANTISNQGGTITGNVVAGSGADSLINSGTISGNVDLGAGADMLTIGTGASFGGAVTAGAPSPPWLLCPRPFPPRSAPRFRSRRRA